MTEVAQKKFLNANNIKKILNSVWTIFVLAVFIAVFWAIDFPYVSLPVLLVYEGLVLYFCRDNIKACIFPMIAISYAITTIHAGLGNWIFYGAIFASFLIFLIAYIIREKVKYNRSFKLGRLFPAFVLSGVGNLLAGVVGYFDVRLFFIVLFFCVLVYFLYWLFINFLTKDCKDYIAYAFIGLAVLISLEIVIAYIRYGDFYTAVYYKMIRIGTGEINAASIFMLSGVCACFYLAQGKKHDYLYMLLGLVLDFFVYLTYSRIALAVCALITLVYFFVDVKESSNKKIIWTGVTILLAIFAILVAVCWEKVTSILGFYLNVLTGKNGREYLWKWCWYQFEDNKLFGIGFLTSNKEAMQGLIPGIENLGHGFGLVNAHNMMLHYLTCTGLVGTALNSYLLLKKYQMVFTKFNKFKFFVLMNYLSIFITSCFDPTPNNSIFHVAITLILLALVELDNEPTEPWERPRKNREIINFYAQRNAEKSSAQGKENNIKTYKNTNSTFTKNDKVDMACTPKKDKTNCSVTHNFAPESTKENSDKRDAYLEIKAKFLQINQNGKEKNKSYTPAQSSGADIIGFYKKAYNKNC